MYHHSPDLHSVRKVMINNGRLSEYVIRTQPNDACMSTVECAAVALAHLEPDPSLIDAFVRPLKALCDFQLQHGAKTHHSKEYLFVNGLCDQPLSEKRLRRFGISKSARPPTS